ncbi:MAG: GtrA family protein [Clostridium sp.]|jgi:putative flippase GtrA|nr:GtrA family protein [Clostridium sp.]
MRELLFKIFKRESFLGKLVDKFFTREIITYIIFGVLTTAVNLVTFYIFKKIFISIGWEGVFNKLLGSAGWDKALKLLGSGTDYLDATVIAWTVAVIFAFVTNKLIVFESKSWKPAVAGKEFVGFIGARLFSLLVELVFMFVMVTLLKWNDFVAKLIVQVIVVILNYVFSKLLIFKNK